MRSLAGSYRPSLAAARAFLLVGGVVVAWSAQAAVIADFDPARHARFLADGWAIDWRQEGHHLWLRNLPTLPPDARGTVIAIELDSELDRDRP